MQNHGVFQKYFKYIWLSEISFTTCSYFFLETKLLQRQVTVMRMTKIRIRHNVKSKLV